MRQRWGALVLVVAGLLVPAQGWCAFGQRMPGMFLENTDGSQVPLNPDGTPVNGVAATGANGAPVNTLYPNAPNALGGNVVSPNGTIVNSVPGTPGVPGANGVVTPPAPTAKMGTFARPQKGTPVVFDADEMGYDHENGIVVARGHVELAQGETIVKADQITYFQQSDIMVAEGNVSILQPSGDVYFSDKAQLNQALKTGALDAIKGRFSDNSVFAAEHAIKVNSAVTKLSDASYTPCRVCATMAPFWQINAGDVKVDDLNERMTYHDATFDVLGVPMFYTPYLSHPTAGSEAQSGFMDPQYGHNSNLGYLTRTPYYWRIADDKEMMITPWYTSLEGGLLQGDYRQLTDHGSYDIQGTATDPEKLDDGGNAIGGHQFRGHIFAKDDEELSDYSRVGFDIQRSSDETYLRRYSLGDQSSLFSRLFAEAAEGRNFASIEGIGIQGLRDGDNQKTTPLILPSIQANYETKPDDNNVRYHVSGDIQALTREEGVDQRRVSMTVGATMPYVSDGGQILTPTVNLRQDVYQSDNVVESGSSTTIDGTNYRAIPQAALEWRLPLLNRMGKDSWTLEPLVLGVVQPNGENPAGISNEDSRLLELTDTNLFAINRMPGLDLVDSGSRLAYGGRTQYLFADNTSLEGLLGQDYNFGTTPFPNSTNPGEHFSDYIGRVAYNVQPISFGYRFAFNNESFQNDRSEVFVTFTRPWLYVNTSYRAIDNNSFINDSKEGSVDMAVPLSESWSLHSSADRNFQTDQFVSAGGGVIFKNECFNVSMDMMHTFTHDRDVAPSVSYMLHFALKNLGQFGYGGNISAYNVQSK